MVTSTVQTEQRNCRERRLPSLGVTFRLERGKMIRSYYGESRRRTKILKWESAWYTASTSVGNYPKASVGPEIGTGARCGRTSEACERNGAFLFCYLEWGFGKIFNRKVTRFDGCFDYITLGLMWRWEWTQESMQPYIQGHCKKLALEWN